MNPFPNLKLQDNKQPSDYILLEFINPSQIGTTLTGENVFLGGFSGLTFAGKTNKNEFCFFTITDRGPNAEAIFIPGIGPNSRPFLLPEFQPRILKLQTNMSNKTFSVVQEIRLTDPAGRPLSGLPQSSLRTDEQIDEFAVNLHSELISSDAIGIDSEGLTIDAAGNFWVAEEYRPSLLKFSSDGKLIKRFIPQGSLPESIVAAENKRYGQVIFVDTLPEILKSRKVNRGFEGITFRQNKVFAIMQSPLENEQDPELQKNTLIIEFDVTSERTTAIYRYPMTRDGVDKIGDIAFNFSGELFAIEQNSEVGVQGIHLITQIELQKNISNVSEKLSLSGHGFDFVEKVEGLAFMSDSEFAVINDNDYGVEVNYDQSKQKVSIGNKKSVMGIFSLPVKVTT